MKKKNHTQFVRAIICIVLVVFIFALFFARLFNWQIIHGEEYQQLSKQSTSYIETSDAMRGEILLKDGTPLAVNNTKYNIVLNKIYMKDKETNSVIMTLIDLCDRCNAKYKDVLPILIDDDTFKFDAGFEGDVEYLQSPWMLNNTNLNNADEIMKELIERYDAKDIEDKELQRKVVSVRYNMEKEGYSFSTVYIFAEDVDENTVAVVSERTQSIPSVEIRTVGERVIKNGELIPHLVGVVGSLSEEDYESHKDEGYALNDKIGKFGLEASLENYLRGKSGERSITKDYKGNIVSVSDTVDAHPGDTVYLTIDKNIQEVANYSLAYNIEKARKAGESAAGNNDSRVGEDCYCGGAVMLSVKDFSVLACATCPSYDLSKYYDPDYNEELYEDEHTPLYSRATDGAFAPGSSFKPCVALAALQEDVISPDTEITCTGAYTYYDDFSIKCGSHGTTTLHNALAASCNYYFAEVGRRTGITPIYLYAEKLGLGVNTGIEVYENTGILAGRDSESFYPGNTCQAAIGQSDNAFTPMQLATYVATIANYGVRYRTHLVNKIVSYDRSETVLYNDPDKPEIVDDVEIDKDYMNEVQSGMRAVCTSGTAAANVSSYSENIAGKTGTAENAGSDHCVFVCYAPYEDPEVAVAVVLEHGALTKYPEYVAMDMMDAYFKDKTLKEIKSSSWGK